MCRHSTKLGFRYSMSYGVNKVLSPPSTYTPGSESRISTRLPHANVAVGKEYYHYSEAVRLLKISMYSLEILDAFMRMIHTAYGISYIGTHVIYKVSQL